MARTPVAWRVKGARYEAAVEPRKLLSEFLRDELELTGVRVSCEHGVCGACTTLVDHRTVRACLMLAVQADGADIRTVEGLALDPAWHPLQGLALLGPRHFGFDFDHVPIGRPETVEPTEASRSSVR